MEVHGELHAPSTLPLGKEFQWIGGRVGLSVRLDVMTKRKISACTGNWTIHPALSQSFYWLGCLGLQHIHITVRICDTFKVTTIVPATFNGLITIILMVRDV
jgi:hypothetical protein